MIYDFLHGIAGEHLKKKILRELKEASVFNFIPLTDINYNRIKWDKGYFTYQDGKDEYLMFAYLRRTNIEKYGPPKYHTSVCETRREYSGFVFSNRMPVSVYCTSSHQSHSGLHLVQCRNCIKEATIKYFKYFTYKREWYDYILDLAQDRQYNNQDILKDGYTVDWKQISWAVREKDKYTCQSCGRNLANHEYQFFLEVHHIDGDKKNNSRSNLKSLCVLCHSQVNDRHKHNYSTGTNYMKIKKFHEFFNI